MNPKDMVRMASLILTLGVFSCLGHNAAKMEQVLLHLAAGDCAEIAHIHRGTAARTVESFCNGTEQITEYQVTIERDSGAE
jgi:hypothetical protein